MPENPTSGTENHPDSILLWQNSSWVRIHDNLFYSQVLQLLSDHENKHTTDPLNSIECQQKHHQFRSKTLLLTTSFYKSHNDFRNAIHGPCVQSPQRRPRTRRAIRPLSNPSPSPRHLTPRSSSRRVQRPTNHSQRFSWQHLSATLPTSRRKSSW